MTTDWSSFLFNPDLFLWQSHLDHPLHNLDWIRRDIHHGGHLGGFACLHIELAAMAWIAWCISIGQAPNQYFLNRNTNRANPSAANRINPTATSNANRLI